MTKTASPVPPRQISEAVDRVNIANGHPADHPDVLSPSPILLKPIPTSDITDAPKEDLIVAPSPAGSSLSDPLSEPPSDEEEIELSLLSGAAEASRDSKSEPTFQNGDALDDEDTRYDGAGGDERPAKRRRMRDQTPPPTKAREPKLESPPWKKFEADGPTTFVDEGKRRSGRISTIAPVQKQADKRSTRKSIGSPPIKNRYASTNGRGAATESHSGQNSTRRSNAAAKQTSPAKSSSIRTLSRKSTGTDVKTTPRTRRLSPSPPPNANLRSSARNRRASHRDSLDPSEAATRSTPRIKLRVTRPTTIPFVHPGQAKIRPKLGPTFEEYFEKARNIPVEDGGQLTTDDVPLITDEGAIEEARILDRIEKEVEPGGLLSEERCTIYAPEPAEEPARQWAHMDHLVKAMANFRKLLLMEQQRHRSTAKKLAEACRDEWLRKQPKSAEEIEQEMQEQWRLKYVSVVRVLFGTWENVKAEINRKRVEEWQAEEQRRVKAALQEAVQISEQKLQARQAHPDEDGITDDDSGIERSSDEDDELDDEDDDDDETMSDSEAERVHAEGEGAEDESNMSSSDDDEDAKSAMSDEGLTQEQLRDKYSHLPELDTTNMGANTPRTPAAESRAGETTGMDDDTSDESVDMDDDMGSSDMDSDEDEDGEADGEDEESEDEDDAPGGLLGLFFGKSELKKLNQETVAEEVSGESGDVDMADEKLPMEVEPRVKGVDDNSAPNDSSTPRPDIGTITNGVAESEPAVPPKSPADPSPEAIRIPLTKAAMSAFHDGSSDPVVPPQFSPLTDYDADPTDFSPDASVAHDVVDPPVTAFTEDQDVAMADLFPPQGSKSFAPRHNQQQTSLSLPPPQEANAEASQPSTASHLLEASGDAAADVMMVDAAAQPLDSTVATGQPDPPSSTHVVSPDTDAVTIAISRDASQSPRTSDTKPSEIDTATCSVEQQDVEEISRSASPGADASGAPKTEIPFLLRGTLRQYQHYGLDWLAGLYANNTNGILADEMGLGKTIQTISLLAHLACQHEVWGPHLVIVPTSVMLNWEMEFKKWCPGFKILTYYGNQEERKRKRQGWTNDDVWNVCITSYQMVLQDQQVFRRRRWHYMILDEAHNIKNFKSQRWQTLLGFNTQARLLLTGTPLQNNLTELWSLLFFLMPSENGVGGFADLKEFHDWFSKPESQILESGREQMDDEARAIISKLHKVLRPYLLRRLKADVEKQMPAKYEHVELCRLSKRQRELYDGFLNRTDTRETLSGGNYLSIINCLMQLRKVCNHPDLFVDRPIMTSFRMQSSVPARFECVDKLVRGKLFASHPFDAVSLEFMNLIPTKHERFSDEFASSVSQYNSHRALNELRDAQKARAHNAYMPLDPSTVESNIIYLESASRWGRYEELQHCVYVNALRRQQTPIYGTRLVELLTLGVNDAPFKPKPKVPKKIMEWFEGDSHLLHNAIQTLDRRADSMEMTITKFACVTPVVVTRDLTPFLLGEKGVRAFEESDLRLSAPVKTLPFMPRERPHDPWHEARMRLSIQFPDKRLLQYDCGKLQALDRLLRKLQAGGHRALIFTQMTKVLDILEQFLNIHGHKYLRLDGATKVEQRQILTDRFNHDTRILCFILSTRSGGLGINLTGADTVIFYDQDWNPAMDKQCQDRCHRIGQTRDVHIYRLVSEHTIEANILRKASQKQMLDDVVIQEGEFTTDYFNKISVRDVLPDDVANGNALLGEGDVAANAAMDRVLGGVDSTDQRTAGRVLEQAEDREDVAAAHVAEKEIQQDDADFSEKPQGGTATAAGSGVSSVDRGTPVAGGIFADIVNGGEVTGVSEAEAEVVEHNAWGERMRTVDDYMLSVMAAQLEGTPLDLPRDKKKSKKKGKDTRKR